MDVINLSPTLSFKARRAGISAVVLGLILIFGYFPISLAQSTANPIPFINQPLVPDAAIPGGASFTLTVNGTSFAAGAVAYWNGSPRTTTFVSSSQLTVSIAASDIAIAGTASVTVANPGGVPSRPMLFQIASPISAVGFAFTPNNLGPCSDLVGDFNGDGKMDLVSCNGSVITVLLGNGDGTFHALPPISNPAMVTPIFMGMADVNNDGKNDLVGFAGTGNNILDSRLSVVLGNGDGTFQQPSLFQPAYHDALYGSMAVGDFNGDGRLDFAVTITCIDTGCQPGFAWVFLSNGDRTFQSPITYSGGLSEPTGLAVGDFNRDGKLDLVISDAMTGHISILLGNGDGTFQAAQSVGTFAPAGALSGYLVAGDLNGDGKLDLVLIGPNSVSVFLGNGDGTFGTGTSFAAPASSERGGPILGDFNGDGKLDIALGVDSGISLLLGNGDGTFQPHTDFNLSLGLPFLLGVGDFNQDGRLDLVVPEGLLMQTTAQVSPFDLSFGNQNDGTTSGPQNVTLTNLASSPLTVNSVAVTGANSGDFAILSNSCGTSVPAGTSCMVGVTFTPAAKGARTASLAFGDTAPASPQTVALTGVGVGTAPAAVSFSPASLAFSAQLLSTTSAPQTVTVTNTGDLTLTVNGIVFQGANPGRFAQTNNCSSLAGGATCNINVTFTPSVVGTNSATLSMIDNATNSPQMLPVSGIGSAPSLGLVVPPGGSSSASVQAGGTASYSLAIGGGGMSGTASLACTGAPTGATCSVPSTISVASATASAFTVNVTTTSLTVSSLSLKKHPGSWAWALLLPGIAILPVTRFKKRPLLRLACLTSLAFFLCSCGGSGHSSNPNGTPAGTYTLTVTATSGSTKQALNLTLIVQ